MRATTRVVGKYEEYALFRVEWGKLQFGGFGLNFCCPNEELCELEELLIEGFEIGKFSSFPFPNGNLTERVSVFAGSQRDVGLESFG